MLKAQAFLFSKFNYFFIFFLFLPVSCTSLSKIPSFTVVFFYLSSKNPANKSTTKIKSNLKKKMMNKQISLHQDANYNQIIIEIFPFNLNFFLPLYLSCLALTTNRSKSFSKQKFIIQCCRSMLCFFLFYLFYNIIFPQIHIYIFIQKRKTLLQSLQRILNFCILIAISFFFYIVCTQSYTHLYINSHEWTAFL